VKSKALRDLTVEDLKKEIDAVTKSLFDLRFKKVTDVVENPAEFRKLRRDLARAKTILREKERAAAAKPAAKA
jgi:large subunit ribosomal protein L29